jgi:hypothetical protein
MQESADPADRSSALRAVVDAAVKGARMNPERLPNRRAAETFDVEANGQRYTATVGRHADGRIGDLFLASRRSNSQADTNARDAGIAFSFAVQHGADPRAIRVALCRDSQGRASGPLGAALDVLLGEESAR